MSTTVVPLARSHWLFQLVGSSVAITAALLLGGAAVAGVTGLVYLPLVLVALAMFGTVFVAAVQALATDGLVLGEHGFTHAGRDYRWADVAEFTPVGFLAKSHVRIVFRPGAEPAFRCRLAQQLGRVGFFDPATHVPIRGYRTGGESLAWVLRQRLNSR
ncbi:MAG: hypothetical protein VYB90_03585 [Actinomycetota bacterium]|nr:hypothetical protein [Actinomycetota bacterium]